MTRQAAAVDVPLVGALGGLLPTPAPGRAIGQAGHERAAGGRVGAPAACGGAGPAGWWGVPEPGRLDLTMPPLPILGSQTPFLRYCMAVAHDGLEGQIPVLRWWRDE